MTQMLPNFTVNRTNTLLNFFKMTFDQELRHTDGSTSDETKSNIIDHLYHGVLSQDIVLLFDGNDYLPIRGFDQLEAFRDYLDGKLKVRSIYSPTLNGKTLYELDKSDRIDMMSKRVYYTIVTAKDASNSEKENLINFINSNLYDE